MFAVVLIVVMAIVLFFVIRSRLLRYRCPQCRRWNALKYDDREILDMKSTFETPTGPGGTVMGGATGMDPGAQPQVVHVFYRDRYECRYCGFIHFEEGRDRAIR